MTGEVASRHRWGLAILGAVIVAGVGLLIPGPVSGQTFREALAATYSTNPAILAGRARLRQADEGVAQALSNWNPKVTTSPSADRHDTKVDTRGTTVTTNLDTLTADLTITQPLYRGGRTVAAIRSAENAVQAERARLIATEHQVLLAAATSHVDVIRDESTVGLNIANERRLQRQLERAQNGYRVGELSIIDVAQAESRQAQAIAIRIASEGQLAISRAVYRRMTGNVPTALMTPEWPVNLPASREDAAAQAARNNPSVIAAQFVEKGAEDDVRVVGGLLLPEASVTGSISRSDSSLTSADGLRTNTRTLDANVTIPLYQAGAIASRHRATKQTVDQRRAETGDARRSAIESATRAFEEYKAARARFDSYSEEIDATEIALEGVEQEAVLGSRSMLDVLDAEQELRIAQVRQVQAVRDEFVAAFQLLAAVGRFTAADLGLAVSLYDPEAYYKDTRKRW